MKEGAYNPLFLYAEYSGADNKLLRRKNVWSLTISDEYQ